MNEKGKEKGEWLIWALFASLSLPLSLSLFHHPSSTSFSSSSWKKEKKKIIESLGKNTPVASRTSEGSALSILSPPGFIPFISHSVPPWLVFGWPYAFKLTHYFFPLSLSLVLYFSFSLSLALSLSPSLWLSHLFGSTNHHIFINMTDQLATFTHFSKKKKKRQNQ